MIGLCAGSAAAQSEAAKPAPLFVNISALEPVKTPDPVYPLEAREQAVQGQVVVRFTVSDSGQVETVETVSGDPLLADAVVKAVKKWKYKPYVVNGAVVPVRTQKTFSFAFSGNIKDLSQQSAAPAPGSRSTAAASSGAAPSSGEATPTTSDDRMKITQGVAQGVLVHQVSPVYPPKARKKGIQGTVVLRAVIGKDGTIHELAPLSGPPELIPAAVGAVQQWRYRPYSPQGEPVEVQTHITVKFVLAH